jgi:hypothetical protein
LGSFRWRCLPRPTPRPPEGGGPARWIPEAIVILFLELLLTSGSWLLAPYFSLLNLRYYLLPFRLLHEGFDASERNDYPIGTVVEFVV